MEQALRYINLRRLIFAERLRGFGLAFLTITGLPDFRLGPEPLKSVESIDVTDLSSRSIQHMEVARSYHGLGIIQINNIQTLISFGGKHNPSQKYGGKWQRLNSVEVWNQNLKTWNLSTNLEITESKEEFGFMNVPSEIFCK